MYENRVGGDRRGVAFAGFTSGSARSGPKLRRPGWRRRPDRRLGKQVREEALDPLVASDVTRQREVSLAEPFEIEHRPGEPDLVEHHRQEPSGEADERAHREVAATVAVALPGRVGGIHPSISCIPPVLESAREAARSTRAPRSAASMSRGRVLWPSIRFE